MTELLIRDALASDFPAIVDLNAGATQHTSPMNLERLRYLDELSTYHRVAETDGLIAGFLLAMRESSPYQNANYEWFSARYPSFLYVDRVVVDPQYGGLRIGTQLYESMFEFARANGIPTVTCEYNTIPPNEPSRLFHDKFGFKELDTQWLDNRTKQVSLQAVEI